MYDAYHGRFVSATAVTESAFVECKQVAAQRKQALAIREEIAPAPVYIGD
jgi:hypothetical protein